MPELVPISLERHANLTWRRPSSYTFAAKDAVVRLASQELPRAIISVAIGFMEGDKGYFPVAVQGFRPGENRLVSPAGQWLGDYLPLSYRTYPFYLARNQEGVEVLCIDEQAGQVSDDPNGETFFSPDGTPAKTVTDVLTLLTQYEKDRQRTYKVCEVLARYQLLEPWPLKVQEGSQILETNGLFRIAEIGLYGLEPAALAEVRNDAGLMMAFAQLFSMQQVHKLAKVGTTGATAPGQPAPKLLDIDGIISFENL